MIQLLSVFRFRSQIKSCGRQLFDALHLSIPVKYSRTWRFTTSYPGVQAYGLLLQISTFLLYLSLLTAATTTQTTAEQQQKQCYAIVGRLRKILTGPWQQQAAVSSASVDRVY